MTDTFTPTPSRNPQLLRSRLPINDLVQPSVVSVDRYDNPTADELIVVFPAGDGEHLSGMLFRAPAHRGDDESKQFAVAQLWNSKAEFHELLSPLLIPELKHYVPAAAGSSVFPSHDRDQVQPGADPFVALSLSFAGCLRVCDSRRIESHPFTLPYRGYPCCVSLSTRSIIAERRLQRKSRTAVCGDTSSNRSPRTHSRCRRKWFCCSIRCAAMYCGRADPRLSYFAILTVLPADRDSETRYYPRTSQSVVNRIEFFGDVEGSEAGCLGAAIRKRFRAGFARVEPYSSTAKQ